MSRECLITSVPYAEEWVSYFSSLRNDWLTVFFKFFTMLGEEYFILGAIVYGLHFANRKTAMRLAFLVVGVAMINTWLKGYFEECRPLSVSYLIPESGFSFPSGHAQGGAAFWAFFIWRSRELWKKCALFIVIALIALSRPYLGVHYFHDIGLGVLIGFALTWAFYQWGEALLQSPSKSFVFLALSFPMCFLDPAEAFKTWGALLGLRVGWHFSSGTALAPKLFGRERTLALLYSGVGILIFWVGLKLLFVHIELHSPFLTMGRYFFLCFCLSFVSPYLASKTRLSTVIET